MSSLIISNSRYSSISYNTTATDEVKGSLAKGVYIGKPVIVVTSRSVSPVISLNTGDKTKPNTRINVWNVSQPTSGQDSDLIVLLNSSGVIIDSIYNQSTTTFTLANSTIEVGAPTKKTTDWWIWGLIVLFILMIIIFVIIFASGQHKVPSGYAAPGTVPPGHAIVGTY